MTTRYDNNSGYRILVEAYAVYARQQHQFLEKDTLPAGGNIDIEHPLEPLRPAHSHMGIRGFLSRGGLGLIAPASLGLSRAGELPMAGSTVITSTTLACGPISIE